MMFMPEKPVVGEMRGFGDGHRWERGKFPHIPSAAIIERKTQKYQWGWVWIKAFFLPG
jgi:hypothetical protein